MGKNGSSVTRDQVESKDTQEVREVERGGEKGIGVSGVEGGTSGMRGTLLLCHSQDSNQVPSKS